MDIIELLKLESFILMSPSHLYAPVVKVLYEGPLHLGNANTEVRVSKLQPVAAAHLFLDKRQAWCNKHFEVSKQLASNFSTTTFGLIELLSAAKNKKFPFEKGSKLSNIMCDSIFYLSNR